MNVYPRISKDSKKTDSLQTILYNSIQDLFAHLIKMFTRLNSNIRRCHAVSLLATGLKQC